METLIGLVVREGAKGFDLLFEMGGASFTFDSFPTEEEARRERSRILSAVAALPLHDRQDMLSDAMELACNACSRTVTPTPG